MCVWAWWGHKLYLTLVSHWFLIFILIFQLVCNIQTQNWVLAWPVRGQDQISQNGWKIEMDNIQWLGWKIDEIIADLVKVEYGSFLKKKSRSLDLFFNVYTW